MDIALWENQVWCCNDGQWRRIIKIEIDPEGHWVEYRTNDFFGGPAYTTRCKIKDFKIWRVLTEAVVLKTRIINDD